MNLAIVDDQQTDRTALHSYIQTYCQSHHIALHADQFDSGEAFLNGCSHTNYDLVFLDIYMGGIDGMTVARKLRENNESTLLVFVTTSEHHAVPSFRVRAFDYLLKPFDYSRLEETMLLCDRELSKHSRSIKVKEGRYWINILLQDIIYVDYSNHYVQIHTVQRIVKTYMPFQEFSSILLTYPQFMICYRNCLINMDHVGRMEPNDFVMQNNEWVPIARKQRTLIRQQYADYAFERLSGGIG